MDIRILVIMKNHFIITFTLLISLTFLSSCYQDINLDKYKGQNGEHLLTINSIINPDSTIAAAVTKTYFFSDVHDARDYVSDLDIRIKVNGSERGKMKFNPITNLYVSTIKPSEKDTVELFTSYMGKKITCRDEVPSEVSIESVSVTRHGPMAIYSDNDYIFTYKITFSDPGDEKNYYFLHYDMEMSSNNLMMGERDYTFEYVFQQLANNINANIPGWTPYSPDGLPFTDEGINGQSHTLVVKEIVQGGYGSHLTRYNEMKRKFKLFSISKDYYEYLLSVLYNDTDSEGLHAGMIDLGISEPMKYFSNIMGGIGIFASYSLDETDLDVIQICGRFPK